MNEPAPGREPLRGEVWEVCPDPPVGCEINKRRPAVVISLSGVGKLPLRIVVPVTEWKPAYTKCPWHIRLIPSSLNGLTKESSADCFQVKSVSMKRFRTRIGVLRPSEVETIAAAVALCVGFRSL